MHEPELHRSLYLIMNHSSIIYRTQHLYTDTVDGYRFVFKPISQRGVTVLNKPSAFIFKLINDKRSVEDIFKIAKKKDPSVTIGDIETIIQNLVDTEIAYDDKPKARYQAAFPALRRLTAWFHITNQCNLRCTYCYISKTAHKMTDEIGMRSIDKLLIDAKKNGFNVVKISFAGGECLLEFKRLIRFVEYGIKKADEIGIKIEFGMVTNGVLITDHVAKTVKKYGIQIAVSLDGFGKANDAQRVFADGSGTFRYILKGIKKLQEHGNKVNLLMTITTHNIKTIPQLFKFCIDNDIIFGTNLFRENPCANTDLTLDMNEAIKYLKKAFRIAYRYVQRINDPQFFAVLVDSMFDRVQVSRAHNRVCGIGSNYITISHRGEVAICPMTISEPVGTIKDEDIVQTMIKKSFIYGKDLITQTALGCRTCPWRNVCCGGCPLAYLHKEASRAQPDYCAVYKTLMPELLRIEARRIIKWGMIENAVH